MKADEMAVGVEVTLGLFKMGSNAVGRSIEDRSVKVELYKVKVDCGKKIRNGQRDREGNEYMKESK